MSYTIYRDGTPQAPFSDAVMSTGLYNARGKGIAAKVDTLAPGRTVLRAELNYRARCGSGGNLRSGRIFSNYLLSESGRRIIAGRARFRIRKDDVTVRIRFRLGFRFFESAGYKVAGSWSVRAKVFRRGQQIDACRLTSPSRARSPARLPDASPKAARERLERRVEVGLGDRPHARRVRPGLAVAAHGRARPRRPIRRRRASAGSGRRSRPSRPRARPRPCPGRSRSGPPRIPSARASLGRTAARSTGSAPRAGARAPPRARRLTPRARRRRCRSPSSGLPAFARPSLTAGTTTSRT